MRRERLTGTLSLVFLSSISSTSPLSGFQNHFSLNLFCSNTLIILVLFLQIIWIIEFTRPNSQHTQAFLFSPFFYLSYHFNFPLNSQNLFLFVTGHRSSSIDCSHLSRQQSPVNCRNRNVEGNFTHKVNKVVIFQAWNLWNYLKVLTASSLKDEELVEFSK